MFRKIALTTALCLAAINPVEALLSQENPLAQPWAVRGEYINIGSQDFEEDDRKDQSVKFQQWYVEAGFTNCICPYTGIRPYAGYYWSKFEWKNNEFFTQTEYPSVELMVSAFTMLVPNWIWKGAFGVRVQTEDFSLGRYGMYQGILWGRCQITECLGVHAGFLFTVGLRDTFVFPILGADFPIAKRIYVYAVFPLDVAAIFCITENFRASLAGRWHRSRFRAGNDNPLPQGLFEYRTWGIEGRLTYKLGCWAAIEAYAGSTVWGWLRVENPTGTNLSFNNLGAAPYYGLEALFNF